jgi:hypothetical protein
MLVNAFVNGFGVASFILRGVLERRLKPATPPVKIEEGRVLEHEKKSSFEVSGMGYNVYRWTNSDVVDCIACIRAGNSLGAYKWTLRREHNCAYGDARWHSLCRRWL